MALSLVMVSSVYVGAMGILSGLSYLSVWLNTEPTVYLQEVSTEAIEVPAEQEVSAEVTAEPVYQEVIVPVEVEIDSFEKQDDGTGSGRLVIWKDALELFVKKPIFGFGPGNNKYFAAKLNVAQVKIAGGADVHNSYLDLLVDYGVIGAGCMLAFWVGSLINVLKKVFNKKVCKEAGYYLAVFCVLTASCASMFLSCIFVSTTAMYYVMLIMAGYIGPAENP